MAETIKDNKQPIQMGSMDQQQAQKRPTSGFTNIQRIVNANKTNKLQQRVGESTNQLSNVFKGNLQSEQAKFQKESEKAYSPYSGGSAFVQKTIQDPTATAGQDFENFRQVFQGNYQGPQGLADEGQMMQNASALQGLANAAGSNYGKDFVLKAAFNKPDYTQGQRRLDSMLLGQGGALKDVRSNLSRTARDINKQTELARIQASNKAANAQELSNLAQRELAKETEARDMELQNRLYQKQEEELKKQADLRDFQERLARGEVYEDELSKLGSEEITKRYDASKDYYQGGAAIDLYGGTNLAALASAAQLKAGGPETKAQVATQADAERFNALQRLAGLANVYDPTKVGQYETSSLDLGDLGKTIDQNIADANYKTRLRNESFDNAMAARARGSLEDEAAQWRFNEEYSNKVREALANKSALKILKRPEKK